MEKIKFKKRLFNKLKEIVNYLYKGVSLIDNFLNVFFVVFFVLIIKFIRIGLQQKLYLGYFEFTIIGFLIIISILQINKIRTNCFGWGEISFIFFFISGISWIYSDSLELLLLSIKITWAFVLGHIFYYFLYVTRMNNEKVLKI